jgi:uncharacterized protein YabN with tetrapyrrole methylase and pyrophosphatase domain
MDGINVEPHELIARIKAGAADLERKTDCQMRQTLLGDLLFDIGNLARKWDIDAESVLREANDRFEQRFRRWEAEHNTTRHSPHD